MHDGRYLIFRLVKYESTFLSKVSLKNNLRPFLLPFAFSNPLSKPEKAVYPDAIAVALDTVNHRVGQCMY